MPQIHRFVLAVSLVSLVGLAGCGSSPTAPDAAIMPAASQSATVATANTTGWGRGAKLAPPTCTVEAIELVLMPPGLPTDRRSKTLEATFKGDFVGCPELVWTVFPAAPLVVNTRLSKATVYDNPENKMGIVDVTAAIGTMRMSATQRIEFPRTGR